MPRLTLLHSNDMHGRLEGLARLTTIVRQQRHDAEAQGRTVFRWDAGDAFDRRFEACRLTRGTALPPVLTASGVTLQTLGNDICYPYGLDVTARMVERAEYPILAANLQQPDGRLPAGLTRSVLLDGPAGLRVGVFGMTDPFDGAYEIYGLTTPAVEVLAAELAQELRAAGAGLIVFLSHLGLDADRQVAQAVPGIDVIIGGHSHDLLLQGERVGETLIAQAGQWAEHLGRVDLDLHPETGRWVATASVIPVPEETLPDPQVRDALAALEEEVTAFAAEPVGTLAVSLTLDYFGESPVVNFAAQVLRERAGAEIGLLSGGSAHTGLSAGPVTRGMLANAFPVTSNPETSRVTGERLWAALERGLDPAVVSQRNGALRGSPMGVPGLSGLRVTVDEQAPVGQRVQEVWVGDEPLDWDRTYRVAHTNLEPLKISFLQGEGVASEGEDLSVMLEDVIREAIRSSRSTVPNRTPAWSGLTRLPGVQEEQGA